MYVTAVLVMEEIGINESSLQSSVQTEPEKLNQNLMKKLGKRIFKKMGTQDLRKDIKEYEFKPLYGESILDAQIRLHYDVLINLILFYLSELPVQYSFYKM